MRESPYHAAIETDEEQWKRNKVYQFPQVLLLCEIPSIHAYDKSKILSKT